MDEIILIDKRAGWTSFDVVAKIRGAIRSKYIANGIKPTKKQLKVGHAGTLDPFATGLLVVLLGDATKKAEEYLKKDKVYEATIHLGASSTTGDPEGEIVKVSDSQPTLGDVNRVIEKFKGAIKQKPPAYSAIKVNGERAYSLARKGKVVDIPTREVTIYKLDLLEYVYPKLTVRAHVSSGTYIRVLAEDVGTSLGVGAYCADLRRVSIGSMTVGRAVTVEDLLARGQF